LWETAKAKLGGHYAFYGGTDNLPGIKRFAAEAEKLLFKGKKPRAKWSTLQDSNLKFVDVTPLK
jgi:hypothetical protein